MPKTSPLNRFIQSRTIERCKYFTFKMIGNAIESLLDDFYSHRFAHLALSRIEYRDLQEILNSTVNIIIFLQISIKYVITICTFLKGPDGKVRVLLWIRS